MYIHNLIYSLFHFNILKIYFFPFSLIFLPVVKGEMLLSGVFEVVLYLLVTEYNFEGLFNFFD
jgi:hypothetical protein